jgi:hypothetical protein
VSTSFRANDLVCDNVVRNCLFDANPVDFNGRQSLGEPHFRKCHARVALSEQRSGAFKWISIARNRELLRGSRSQ